jgi:hypothetical protein
MHPNGYLTNFCRASVPLNRKVVLILSKIVTFSLLSEKVIDKLVFLDILNHFIMKDNICHDKGLNMLENICHVVMMISNFLFCFLVNFV